MARSCGGCSACRKVLRIETPELSKPLGQWCPNCHPGQGCGIYETRPSVCRDFRCSWLATEILPDHARKAMRRTPLRGGPTAKSN